MTRRPLFLLISGSLRSRSTNTAVLRTAQVVAGSGPATVLHRGLDALPHFNPDDDQDGAPVHEAVADLRAQLRDADAVVFSTPEYAGALPGSFKNLLDWTVGGGETYGKPVAWINVSGAAAPTGGADAHESLSKVLGYTGARIVSAACVHIPVPRSAVGEDGLIGDPLIRERIGVALRALAEQVECEDHDPVEEDSIMAQETPDELPIACTLGPGEQVSRRERWLALAEAAMLEKRPIATGVRLRFAPRPGVESELRQLAAAERECCAFATWQVRRQENALVLEVDSEPDAVPTVWALFELEPDG